MPVTEVMTIDLEGSYPEAPSNSRLAACIIVGSTFACGKRALCRAMWCFRDVPANYVTGSKSPVQPESHTLQWLSVLILNY